MEQVDVARIPNFLSFLPRSTPGASIFTRNAEIPLCFCFLSSVAKIIAASASMPDVTQDLVPLRMKKSPSRVAVVDKAATSLPASKNKIFSEFF